MGVIIMDQEIIQAGIMISSTMEEIIKLNSDFSKIIESLTTKGYQDVLISSALVERAVDLSNTITKINDLTKETGMLAKNYIDKIDEKDKYLY